MLPFIKTPILDAAPIPPKKDNGIDITKAQGHETTKKERALYNHSLKDVSFIISGGITANKKS